MFKFCFDRSLSENAEDYFKKAKKLRNKAEGERRKLELMYKKLEEMKKKKEELEKTEKEKREFLAKLKKGEWYEKFRYFFTSKGNLVVCGKDATSNEVLIKKYSNNFKWVFHTELPGSPFCLTNAEDKEELKEVADFVAIFSSAWKSNLASTDVFYVRPEQLKKNDPNGVVLPKGSFYIEGKKNFILGETKFSVGLKNNNLYFGPYSTISKICDYYVTIVPGRKSRKELAKEIGKRLKIKYWQLIQDFLPSNGEIAKSLTRDLL